MLKIIKKDKLLANLSKVENIFANKIFLHSYAYSMNIQIKEMIDIKNIVKTKAKYQKVMLLFDESVGNVEIKDVYELIKTDCIFNQMSVNNLDIQELMNGYKLIIYYMTGNSFLHLDFYIDEFVNIFVPTDAYVLPFFMDRKMSLSENKDYLIIENKDIDFSFVSSLYFNRVFKAFFNVLYNTEERIDFVNIDTNYLKTNIVEILNTQNFDGEFVDLKIIKQAEVEIEMLPVLDFVLLVALELFLKNIRNKSLSLIDVYKLAQNDDKKINIYYEMMNNFSLLEILNLNFNCLLNLIKISKEHILEILQYECGEFELEEILKIIRSYATNDEGLLGYMYFYDIFSI